MEITNAVVNDADAIYQLINKSAASGKMLPRSLSSIYDFIRDFLVCRDDASGEIIGICALHICWDNLAEIRSLAVAEPFRKSGVGRRLVGESLTAARSLGITRVFVLTYVPEFFAKLGFTPLPKSELPHKIWADCVNCVKFPNCDEESLIIDLTD